MKMKMKILHKRSKKTTKSKKKMMRMKILNDWEYHKQQNPQVLNDPFFTNTSINPSFANIVGTKQAVIILLDKELLIKLSKPLHTSDIPEQDAEQLMTLKLDTASLIINAFGGGTNDLAQQLSYKTPLIFHFKTHEVTLKVIRLSWFLVQITYNERPAISSTYG